MKHTKLLIYYVIKIYSLGQSTGIAWLVGQHLEIERYSMSGSDKEALIYLDYPEFTESISIC